MNEINVIDFLKDNSIWVLFAYMVLNGLIPAIRKTLELWMPETIKRRKLVDERLADLKEKELDVKEREIVAWERIAKALVLIENSQARFSTDWENLDLKLLAIQNGVSDVNRTVGMLWENSIRRRESDYHTDKKDGE